MKWIMAVLLGGILILYLLTVPEVLVEQDIPQHTASLENGESLFWAGGCASCHAAAVAKHAERLKLGGGRELQTPFGVFRVPNVSSDGEAGIGDWSKLDFINAMVNGVSPQNQHYYPAFPYTHYRIMTLGDLLDLKAYLDTLPAVSSRVAGHDLKFPFNIRRAVGLWKMLYMTAARFQPDPNVPALLERGRYLVQGLAHCGACHTPRDMLGGQREDLYLAGAPAFESGGDKNGERQDMIPNITPHEDGIGDWSEADIVYALQTGFDPDFDSFGGSMVEVQENMAKISAQDRQAIAVYLKSIPAIASPQQ